jgi:DNA-binding transcriptional MocR family regulator
MSWQAARSVLDLDGMKPTSKFVLMAIALRAGTDGRAWPSIARLCADTGYNQSTTRRAIKQLSRAGLVEVIHSPGKGLVLTLTAPSVHGVTAPFNGAGAPSNDKKRAFSAQQKSKEENMKYAPAVSPAKRTAGADNGNGRAPVDKSTWVELADGTVKRAP